MKLITVTGYKGGVGKSCTALHLATYLSEKAKVILVDGDPNRTALAWAERGSLPFKVADERRAMRLIQGHDYVVIDTPARPNSDDLKELAAGCNLLILPTIPDVVSLEPMLATAAELKGHVYRALIAIVPPKPNRDGEIMRADLVSGGVPVFETMIRRSIGFSKAAIAGVPVRDLKGSDRLGWLDYQALGHEVMKVISDAR